jgi:farnesyl-diphosphate farnesyltransferase
LTGLLKEVSRSFYLTLRILPKSVRSQIGLAYLLARTTDTIADTEIIPVERRLRSLEQLRDRILGRTTAALDFAELIRNQGAPAERVLLEKVEAGLSLLNSAAVADRTLIREVLETITSGQCLDLQRFAGASRDHIVALRTEDELDDYTYRVAGCVGEFWTKICVQNQFGAGFLNRSGVSEKQFTDLGVRFGKGLQLVNILRDLPVDLHNGRCYLPAEPLSTRGLRASDLLDSNNEPRLRPLYDELLDRAHAHLIAGWKYTNLIPRSQMRVRLACAWPILIGLKTIGLLRTGRILDPQQRIKISRRDVRDVIVKSLVTYPLPAWRSLPGQF